MKLSKRQKQYAELVDKNKKYSLSEAVDTLKKLPQVKFDASIDVQMKLTADPNVSTQIVRGTTLLPHGTGRDIRIVVLAKGEAGKAAKEAGAKEVGAAELVDKIAKGWLEFDAVVASPDMMREVGKLGKVLGPRGLMPSPKAGTVTENVVQAVHELKKGRIEFKMDKQSNLHCQVGKLSFDQDKIIENIKVLLNAVAKARPKDVKGNLIASACLSSSMGPGIRLDKSEYREMEAES